MEVITTIPPYANYIRKVAKHPIISGVRLNTVMPVKETLDDLVARVAKDVFPKEVWIDLKCRQIRVTNYASVPYNHLEISHKIKVKTPTTAYFSDGEEHATLAEIVDGNKLIMLDGPKRVVGPGESINITDSSLEIEGYLTPKDKEYISAAKKSGVHNYMLSYVESASDIETVFELDPEANVLAKIESQKGLNFVEKEFSKYQGMFAKHKGKVHLMTARGDLYVEVNPPHKILNEVKKIAEKDSCAVAASRIMASMNKSPVPSCSDLSDVGYLMMCGYNRLMIGDDLCFDERALISALNVLQGINNDFKAK
jgi:pyruvate kinase